MDKEFNYKESLKVIDEMIAQAKYRPRPADSAVTLLWGYLVGAAALLHWFLEVVIKAAYAPIAWLLIVAGGIATAVISRKSKRQQRVKTYVDTLISQVWIAFSICLLLLFFTMQPVDGHFLPVVMLLYGAGQWVYGALLKFAPLQAGATACWLGGALAFFLPQEQQLLALAAVVTLGYIVPGHLLSAKSRKPHV